MNISYNWLKRYIDTDLGAEEVARILTDIGLEVEGFEKIETIKGGLAGVVVGEVLTCEDHPDSDHLHVTTVDVGTGEPLQIVCGAPIYNQLFVCSPPVADQYVNRHHGHGKRSAALQRLRNIPERRPHAYRQPVGADPHHRQIAPRVIFRLHNRRRFYKNNEKSLSLFDFS